MTLDSDPTIRRVKNALLPLDIKDGAHKVQREGQRAASVLMPLVKRDDWQVILTQRPDTMPTHAGQISFPGGRIEPGEGPRQAALRETYEEIGVPKERISLLGRLPSFNATSQFRVTPYVGVVDAQVNITPDPREVAEAFEVPFSFLMNDANHVARDVEWKTQKFTLYDMPYNAPDGTHRNIWGMTAMVMYRLWQRAYQGVYETDY